MASLSKEYLKILDDIIATANNAKDNKIPARVFAYMFNFDYKQLQQAVIKMEKSTANVPNTDERTLVV